MTLKGRNSLQELKTMSVWSAYPSELLIKEQKPK